MEAVYVRSELVEEIHRRYKVQIEIWTRGYEEQEKRYNLYILEMQKTHARVMSE